MDLKQQTIDTYNASAELMAQKFNNIQARVADIERGLSFLQMKNPSVLEIGCGNGRDAQEIVKHTDRYLGIDISQSMIDIAQRTLPEQRFVVADIESYTFEHDIDIIFSFASLLHSPPEKLEQVFRSAHTALSADGVFYISLKLGQGESIKTDAFGTRVFYLYTPEVVTALAGAGYTVIYSELYELLGQEWLTLALRKVS
jgi:SAM-dependent methyltransferase